MITLKKAAKGALKTIGRLMPLTKKEKRLLESILEKRFLNFGAEPTNVCNANCPFCGYKFSKKPKRTMPLSLYRKIIEQYSSLGGGAINLTPTIGDPLVDRTIIEKIKIAKSYPAISNIFFYTNLLNLNRFDVVELLKSGIGRISVSASIGSREMYFRIFGVDKYDTLFSNLIKLLEANKILKNSVSIILALRCDADFDFESSDDYKKILELIGKKNITHLPNDRGYDNWGGAIKKEDLPKAAVFRESKKEKIEPCAELYRRINILANGDVNFCICRDYNYELLIGNIEKEGLLEIWGGNKLKELRSGWKCGKIPDICINCSNYVPLSEFLRKSRIAIWASSLKHIKHRC